MSSGPIFNSIQLSSLNSFWGWKASFLPSLGRIRFTTIARRMNPPAIRRILLRRLKRCFLASSNGRTTICAEK